MKDQIRKSIREIAKNDGEMYSVVCTVDSVNTSAKTCKCVPVDGKADLLGVRLMAQNQTGFYIIPKVNSVVVVTMTNGFTGYVAMFSEVQEIQLNGSNYDGLIKVEDVLSAINTRNTTFKTAITAALTSIDASIVALGGASVSSAAFTAATASITNILKASVENTTVKHGNG